MKAQGEIEFIIQMILKMLISEPQKNLARDSGVFSDSLRGA